MSNNNDPFAGVPDFLQPNPPPEIPEAPGVAAAATVTASPFSEPQDVDSIIKSLTLDRPLKLFIPNREKYPDHEFHIINSIAGEFADAHNKGFKEVTNPELVGLFKDLVSGSDKDGKMFRPVLMARPKQVGEHVRERQRGLLQNLYAGMDPKNKEVGGKYTSAVDSKDGTFLQRSGAPWSIRIRK